MKNYLENNSNIYENAYIQGWRNCYTESNWVSF